MLNTRSRISLAALLLLAAPLLAQDESLAPDTTDSSDSNTTCDATVHTSIDEDPDSPAGNCGIGGSGVDCCRADSNNTNWSFIVTMPTPSSPLDTSADAQAIKIYAESFDEGQSDDPTIQVNIYDTTTVACDTLHESGTVTTLTDAGFPAVITDNWTAAGLSAAADVCVEVVCTKSGGAPGARNSCDIDAMEWDVTWSAGGGTIIGVIGK